MSSNKSYKTKQKNYSFEWFNKIVYLAHGRNFKSIRRETIFNCAMLFLIEVRSGDEEE